ncbi:MAG TPA: hypothetical protein VIJ72_03465 [Rhizomicrobium sp.]
MSLKPSQKAAYEIASSVVKAGRELLFEGANIDLPPNRSETIANDDRIPQVGFIGDNYDERRILVVGINPGNGPSNFRSPSDAAMFLPLYRFVETPSHETYAEAMAAQMTAFPSWLASQELGPKLDLEGVTTNDIAYINASPYRAGNGTANDVFRTVRRKKTAAAKWVGPMLFALRPAIVIAHGVEAARIINYADRAILPLIFNRVRIKAQRDAANATFSSDLRTRLKSA